MLICFDYDKRVREVLKMTDRYDINSLDTRNPTKHHRIPDSLMSALLTSCVGPNNFATAEDMLV